MQQKQALTTVRALRDFFHHSVSLRTGLYENRFNGEWLLFHTALDTIEDGLIAVDKFQQHSTEHIRLNPLLSLAGLLQLIYVQLDAVKFLVESFEDTESEENVFFSENILKIRYLRNNTVGHPVKNTGGKRKIAATKIAYTLLPVPLIEQLKFTYILQYSDGEKTKEIREYQIICVQVDVFIHTVISKLILKLQQEEHQHKAKFSEKKLALFDISLYHWYESCFSLGIADNNGIFYNSCYNQVQSDIEQFKSLFNERVSVKSQQIFFESIPYIMNRVRHIMDRLSPNIVAIDEHIEREIYANALTQSIVELQEIAREFDEIYANTSNKHT